MFNKWFQSGIKYIRDIYDQNGHTFYSFGRLREVYNLSNTDFLKYISLISSIPKEWKNKIRAENIILTQLLKVKQANKFTYNILVQKVNADEKKSEDKWNEIFLETELNWKTIYLTPLRSINDTQLRNFQYKYLLL